MIINVISNASDYKYQDQRVLTITADNQIYRLGTMSYRVAPETGFGGFTGILSLSIPAEEFRRMAGAKRIRIKLGSKDYELEVRNLQKWRALADTMPQ